ncbi:MAG: MBL fold metallo-hydrolase, partial [Desulfurococcales archaeon]|nr:MBL fold metallo-hydrolase [Desulfurococcales archaeon]
MASLDAVASVKDNGAILLGSNVVADSHWRRLVRVVTHAHADHYRGLPSSVRESLAIVATPITFELLNVLGFHVPSEKAIMLDYNRGFIVEEEYLTLRRSRHIAGSAQVEVETRNARVGYTGDFKMPGTAPLR